jgi:hypothetical protein
MIARNSYFAVGQSNNVLLPYCIGGSVVMAVMVVVMVVGWWAQRVVERHRSILSRSKRTNKAISIVDRNLLRSVMRVPLVVLVIELRR